MRVAMVRYRDEFLLSFVTFMVFLWSNGFNLRILDLSSKYQVLNLTAHFLLLLLICIRVPFVKKWIFLDNTYFYYLLIMVVVIFAPTSINLVVVNGLNFIEVLRSSFGYCGLLIFIVLISYRTSEQFVAKLNKRIYAIVTLNIIALIILSANPTLAESLLLNTMSRYDRIRLMISAAIGSMPHFYFFYTLVMCKGAPSGREFRKYLLLLAVYVWYFLALDMSRRTILSLIVVTGLFYFLNTSIKTKVKIIFVTAITLPVLWMTVPQFETLADAVVMSYLTSRSEYEGEEGNVGIRVDGIGYYFDMLVDSGYQGIGLYSNRLPDSDPYTHAISLLKYNPNDHGIFAVIYEYGVLGVAFTIYLLFATFRDLKTIKKHGLPEDKPIATAFSLYLIFNMMALLQIFWKPSLSIWTGILLFMIWKMRQSVLCASMHNIQPHEAVRP